MSNITTPPTPPDEPNLGSIEPIEIQDEMERSFWSTRCRSSFLGRYPMCEMG